MGLFNLVGVPIGMWLLLYRAVAPFSMFIGEVRSVFLFPRGLGF